jgi:hypothetical protein
MRSQSDHLWPRIGVWLLVAGIPAANALLWRHVRRRQCLSDRLLLAVVQWRAFGQYFDARCVEVDTIATADYGDINVYRCSVPVAPGSAQTSEH